MYGSSRILTDLNDYGETVLKKAVAASTGRQRVQGISPRKFGPISTIRWRRRRG